jgi:hypothetical protein
MTALPSLAVIPEGNRLAGKPVPYEMDQFVPLARMFADVFSENFIRRRFAS